MLSFSGSLKVFVALEGCDMRKSFNGLHALCTERLGEDKKRPQPAKFGLTKQCDSRLSSVPVLCALGVSVVN